MIVDDLRQGDEIVLPVGQRYEGETVTVNTIARGAVTTVIRVDRTLTQHFAVQLSNNVDVDVVGPNLEGK